MTLNDRITELERLVFAPKLIHGMPDEHWRSCVEDPDPAKSGWECFLAATPPPGAIPAKPKRMRRRAQPVAPVALPAPEAPAELVPQDEPVDEPVVQTKAVPTGPMVL